MKRRNAQSESGSTLPSAVAVFMVFTFIVFGVGESAFAQSGLVKVQKRSSQKRVEENVPRIMPADPPEHGVPSRPVNLEGTPLYPPTPPVYVEAPRDPIPSYPLYPLYPWTPAQPSQPGTPGGQPSNPEPGGGSGGETPPEPILERIATCTCTYYSGLKDQAPSASDPCRQSHLGYEQLTLTKHFTKATTSCKPQNEVCRGQHGYTYTEYSYVYYDIVCRRCTTTESTTLVVSAKVPGKDVPYIIEGTNTFVGASCDGTADQPAPNTGGRICQ